MEHGLNLFYLNFICSLRYYTESNVDKLGWVQKEANRIVKELQNMLCWGASLAYLVERVTLDGVVGSSPTLGLELT